MIGPLWFPRFHSRRPRTLSQRRQDLVERLDSCADSASAWPILVNGTDGPSRMLRRVLPRKDHGERWERELLALILGSTHNGEILDLDNGLVVCCAAKALVPGSQSWLWLTRRVLVCVLNSRFHGPPLRVGRLPPLPGAPPQGLTDRLCDRYRLIADGLAGIANRPETQDHCGRAALVGAIAASHVIHSLGRPGLSADRWEAILERPRLHGTLLDLGVKMAHGLTLPDREVVQSELLKVLHQIPSREIVPPDWGTPCLRVPQAAVRLRLDLDLDGRIVPALPNGKLGRPLSVGSHFPLGPGQQAGRALLDFARRGASSKERIHRTRRSALEGQLRNAMRQAGLSGDVSVELLDPPAQKMSRIRVVGVRISLSESLTQAT